MAMFARVAMLWGMLVLGWAAPVQAQDWAASEFDARPLTVQERRFVQAALVFSGDYVGLLDGQWGRGSQQALERYASRTAGTLKPEFRDLKSLLAAFEAEQREKGWQSFYSPLSGMSFAVPINWVVSEVVNDAGSTYTKFSSPGGDFIFALSGHDAQTARRAHDRFRSSPEAEGVPYVVDKQDRLVTAMTMRGGMRAYLRTDQTAQGVTTLSIFADAIHRNRVALMSASIQRGDAPKLALPSDGLLAKLSSSAPAGFALDRPVPETQPAPPPATPAAVPKHTPAGGSGTGFYVTADRIVSAAHVVKGCGRMALADGTTLAVLVQDDALDLAVLAAPRGSPAWISIAQDVRPRLGEPVMAVGFPYLGTLGQGLTVTGGNISALQGIGGNTDRMMISAPVQPGNSGGPLLNGQGQVIGVVVSRVNDLTLLKETGSLPQNMNFAVPVGDLSAFLAGADVLTGPGAEFDIAKGLPDATAAAIVPLMCHP